MKRAPLAWGDMLLVYSLLYMAKRVTLSLVRLASDEGYAQGDTELPPLTLQAHLQDWGVETRVIVSPDCRMPGLVREHIEAGRVALAWMGPGAGHPGRWWASGHVCDRGEIRLGFYGLDRDGMPQCCRLSTPQTGHYLCLDLPFVSAEVENASLGLIRPN